MEGHISPVATDSSYIKQNADDVKEYYMAALDDLSLEKAEVKALLEGSLEAQKEFLKALEAHPNTFSDYSSLGLAFLRDKNFKDAKTYLEKVNKVKEKQEYIEKLRELISAGMNVARFNFSHGSYEEHQRRIER